MDLDAPWRKVTAKKYSTKQFDLKPDSTSLSIAKGPWKYTDRIKESISETH